MGRPKGSKREYYRYYHYIIGRTWEEEHGNTDTRKEIVIYGTDPVLPVGWQIVGCCGYHDVAIENKENIWR